MLSRLPLNSLNTFAAAADKLSFQAASELLYVTPSAVSHQIRHLEELLGYKLFERLDKRVRLTSQGERLFNDIRVPISQLHEAARRAQRGVEDNSLAISVAPMLATGWLLPRLKDFYLRNTDINLSVVAATELVDFSSDPFDASIRMGRGGWRNVKAVPLFASEIVAVCRPEMLEGPGHSLEAQEIADSKLIQNAFLPNLWKEWFESAGLQTTASNSIRLSVQGSAQLVEAVQSADAFGLIDRRTIERDIEQGRLVIASEQVLRSDQAYYLTYPESNSELSSLQRFEAWLLEQIPGD